MAFYHFKCLLCEEVLKKKRHINNHLRDKHNCKLKVGPITDKLFRLYTKVCSHPNCKQSVGNEDEVVHHFLTEHKRKKHCVLCNRYFDSDYVLETHLDREHPSSGINQDCDWRDYQIAAQGRYMTKRHIFPPNSERDIPAMLLLRHYKCLKNVFKNALLQFGVFCVSFYMSVLYEKASGVYVEENGERVAHPQDLKNVFHKLPYTRFTYFNYYTFKSFLHSVANALEDKRRHWENEINSGYVMRYITNLDLTFLKLSETGDCAISKDGYSQMSKVWKSIEKIKPYLLDASITTNKKCFYSAVAAGLLRMSHPNLCEDEVKRKIKNFISRHLNTKGFTLPFKVKRVNMFEIKNEHLEFGINVYTWTPSGEFIPMYISKTTKSFTRINILLLQPDFRISSIGHYVLITDLNKLVHSVRIHGLNTKNSLSYSQQNRRQRKYRYICELCLYGTTSFPKFKTHSVSCKNDKYQSISYPLPGSTIRFENKGRDRQSPFLCFLDFEAKMSKIDMSENGHIFNCNNCVTGGPVRLCSHSERYLQAQLPMTYSMYVFKSNGELFLSQTYSSDTDVMEHFFNTLNDYSTIIEKEVTKYKELFMSARQKVEIQNAVRCYLCKIPFVPGQDIIVADHCHLTPPQIVNGEKESHILGAAHRHCNLQRQKNKQIPIYVHNLMSYDSNFILGYLHKHKDVSEMINSLTAMPYNSTKFRTFVIDIFSFKDSFQLLSGSLSELSEDLSISNNPFKLLKQANLVTSDSQYELLFKKAVYPYEWVTSVSQLIDTTDFPPHSAFFSNLKRSNISLQDYNQGQQIYNDLNCSNMLDYTELYCKLDTLLLAEVVFSYRELIWNEFGLALENYLSTPQIALDACLKLTGKSIGLMSEPSMVTMIENSLRGGVSFVNNRHETSATENETLLYIDANNLYGFAQKLMMPVGEFSFLKPPEFRSLKWQRMTETQPYGYIAEVDLEFPPSCHDLLDDLPLAPAHTIIKFKNISPFSQNIHTNIHGSYANKYSQQKLVTDLHKKTHYCVHYLNLQFYLEKGAQITKIHSVIKFKQDDFLKTYINLISKKRAESKTSFKKRLFKLLANALYGKFIQDVRKYSKVVFCRSATELSAIASDPLFIDATVISDNLIACTLRNEKINLNKAYAIGFSILELSKLFMYRVWYDQLKPTFKNDIRLCLTDTDSFIVKINNFSKSQIYELIAPIMDFSNLPTNSPFYNKDNAKVPGFFKDEYPNDEIEEVIGVRSKCYFIKLKNNNKSHVVCKGISKASSKTFTLDLYKSCIYSSNAVVKTTDTRIKALKEKVIVTESLTKQAFASPDEKRYQLCHIHSIPYGHYKIPEIENNKLPCYKCM